MAEEKQPNSAEAAPIAETEARAQSPRTAPLAEEEKIKRRNRMDSVKAEAIARLRSSDIPEGCGIEYDVSPEGRGHDVEVVFKERTAL